MNRVLASLCATVVSSSLFAATVQNGMTALINSVDPNINMGIEVLDLTTGQTLYSRNASKAFVPASNMKLFSDAAALLALGPDYRFTTKLATDANQLNQGVLNGHLYLYMPGDPSLKSQDLQALFTTLKTWGVRRIHGDVVIVSSHGAAAAYAPGSMKQDQRYSYGAPVGPVVLDENRLMVTINPAHAPGLKAIVEYPDPSHTLILDNQTKTAPSGSRCGVGVSLSPENHLVARGCVGVGQWSMIQKMPILNPLKYTQGVVRSGLGQEGIQLEGQVRLGQAPRNTLLIASHASKPIHQLMADTLKPSDNLYADSLFLHAAEKLHGAPVNWAQAQGVVKNFLQNQTGVNLQQASLTDGSGLSRQDLLTPAQTIGLLRFLHERFPLSYEYIAALPVSGRDGTLQRRFRKPTQKGMIRAKTGTMTGVMSLSGYLYTANAHTLAFAIFVNRTPGTKPSVSGKYRYLVDALCDYLIQHKIESNQIIKQYTKPTRPLAFEQRPTASEAQRARVAKWRRLELNIKQALRGKAVTVVFRGEQLELRDNDPNGAQVWAALQRIKQQNSFAAMVESAHSPAGNLTSNLLWVNKKPNQQVMRLWTLKDAVG